MSETRNVTNKYKKSEYLIFPEKIKETAIQAFLLIRIYLRMYDPIQRQIINSPIPN
jgi:hypothetical protein